MENSCLPGTILKIKAQNFVSYSDLSFRPSNRVNILLAPNGAGKSSLLSAIVLGLGGQPEIIGKSNQVSDYISYGKDEARIRLDLYDPVDNVLSVGRIIKKKGSSIWYINKKKVALQEVKEAMKRLNIHIDSLCQVLPQERVQDFAKMNSLQLLENVQNVLAGDLSTNYSILLKCREEIKNLKEEIDKKTVLEQDETAKYSRLEKEVEAIKEKKRVMKMVDSCLQKLAWTQYSEKKEELEKVTGYLAEVQDKLSEFERSLEVLKRLTENSEKKQRSLLNSVKHKRSQVNRVKDEMRTIINQVLMCNAQVENIKESRRKWLKEADSLKLRLNEEENKIQELTQLLASQNGEDLFKSVSKLDGCIRDKMKAMQSVIEQEEQKKKEQIVVTNALFSLESKLEQFNSVGKKRLNMLSAHNPDIHKSYAFLNQNRQRFKSNIYGPILLELSVTITEGAKYIERIIPFQDLISFVTEEPSDTSELLRILKGKEKLAVNCAHCDPPRDDLPNLFPPIIPLETIRALGFDCYLIDLVEGPATVLKHLCNLFKLHLKPVAFSSKKVNCAALSQYPEINQYFIGDEFFRVSSSRYVKSKSSVVSRVRPARFLADTIDKELVRHTKIEIASKREMQGELEGELANVVEYKKNLIGQLNELKNQKKQCAQQLEQFKSSTVKLRRFQEERMQVLNTIKEGQQHSYQSDDKIKKILSENMSRLRKLVDQSKSYSRELVDCSLSEHNLEAAKLCVKKNTAQLSLERQGSEQLKNNEEELLKSLSAVKAETKSMLAKAKESTGGLEMGQQKFTELYGKVFRGLPDEQDKIKDKLLSHKARAKCLDNPLQQQHLQEYKAAKLSADNLRIELDKMKEEMNSTHDRFRSVFSSWLPEIDSLVSKLNDQFSNFFTKMNCVGEVRLNTEDDKEAVEKFGLEIRVKFRNDAKLEVLDQYLQSGGERALTTAVFLLSLQRLTNLPFRCVDEINQGMDEFNERRVYNLLFKTTGDVACQYFLFTPKFLSHVEYPSTCTVHFVFNCPMYRLSTPMLSTEQSQVFSKLDENLQVLIAPEEPVLCKDNSEKENVRRVKRIRIN